jgi:hypothetical protein
VKEPTLVKDVLRVAQALSGTYCKLSAAADAGSARLQVAGWQDTGLSPSERHTLHLLAELGVVYRCGLPGARLAPSLHVT